MLLSPSARGSFSIPVHINLRRRRTRDILQSPTKASDSKERRNPGTEKAKAPTPVSSVGEERALLLGIIMMAFSLFMYFMVGIVAVKPCVDSDWGDATNCSLIQIKFLNESDDWKGVSGYPCLQVTVNITASGTRMRLRYDETAVNLSQECFYTPKNHQTKSALMEEAQNIEGVLCGLQDQDLTCHLSARRYPDDAILKKRHDLRMALWCLLWPSLMLGGGALLVGLVKLTQWLAHLTTKTMQEEDGEEGQGTAAPGKLYRMTRCRLSSSSMEEEEESAS